MEFLLTETEYTILNQTETFKGWRNDMNTVTSFMFVLVHKQSVIVGGRLFTTSIFNDFKLFWPSCCSWFIFSQRTWNQSSSEFDWKKTTTIIPSLIEVYCESMKPETFLVSLCHFFSLFSRSDASNTSLPKHQKKDSINSQNLEVFFNRMSGSMNLVLSLSCMGRDLVSGVVNNDQAILRQWCAWWILDILQNLCDLKMLFVVLVVQILIVLFDLTFPSTSVLPPRKICKIKSIFPLFTFIF